MRPKNRNKRQQGWEEVEEEEVDDLAVAASFAQAKPEAAKQPEQSYDEKEQDTSSDDEEGGNQSNKSENERDFEDDGSDDDGSEVDLSEALATMINDDKLHEDEDHEEPTTIDTQATSKGTNNTTDSQPPRTQHELDSYRTPISDLETQFQLNLTVAEQERLWLDKETSSLPPNGGPVQLCAAGHVKCHMVEDRTIVVESVGGARPLDEGSLLVVRFQNNDDYEQKSQLLSLGKIFEVFGPVSKPLYTIRLPSPKDRAKKKQAPRKVEKSMERDEDEISLDDDQSSEHVEKGSDSASEDASAAENAVDGNVDSDASDRWAPNGQYTKLLQTTERIQVYYISDVAKLLDTGAVIRNSGRGCDASNLYDEEVLNANDMYFSDDEQEREYKNRNKPGKKSRRRNNGGRGGDGRNSNAARTPSNYTGFHSQQNAMTQQNYPPQYAMPPTAIHQPMQYQAGTYPGQQLHQYWQQQQGNVGAYAYAQGSMPPPPPPPPPSYPYPTYHNGQSQASPNPNQGSPEESSDTVYYD